MIIYLIGLPGVGKTTIGIQLAKHLNFSFIDLDAEIEKSLGMSVAEIFQHRGEDYFREIEKRELLQTSLLKNTVIATGGGTPCFFDNMEMISKFGKSIHLTCSLAKIQVNLDKDETKRPLLQNLKTTIGDLFIQRKEFYDQADLILDLDETSDPVVEIISFLNL